MLEANHDLQMLEASRYPAFLKRRIGGKYGHLANTAAAALLSAVQHPGLACVIAAHLSAQNNTPALAQQALGAALGWPADRISVASPVMGTPWITVGAA